MRAHTDEDEEGLLRRLRNREPDALVELYRLHKRRVFSLIYHMVKSRAAAEEILQDTFMRLWERSHLYNSEKGALQSWLLMVARNCSLDYLRKESVRTARHVSLLRNPADLEDFAGEARRSTVELEQAVKKALAALPVEQRTVIEMAYFEGLTQEELAERTRRPLGTIKSQIRLGFRKLREALAAVGHGTPR